MSLRISGPELTIPRVNRGNLHVQRRTLSRSIGDTKRKAEKLAEFLVVAEKEKRHNRCLESCACDPQKMLLRLYRRGGLPRQKCCGERMPVSLVPFLKNKGALSHLPWKPEWDLHLPGQLFSLLFSLLQYGDVCFPCWLDTAAAHFPHQPRPRLTFPMLVSKTRSKAIFAEMVPPSCLLKPSLVTRSEYWRSLFPKITVADIESFGNKYQVRMCTRSSA